MNKNQNLSDWYYQLSYLYKFAHRKNIEVNLLDIIKLKHTQLSIKQQFPKITYFNVNEWNISFLILPVGFVKIQDDYIPVYNGDIVYVDGVKYVITDIGFYGHVCMTREFDSNKTVYLKFDDMVLNPCVEYIDLDGKVIIKPRKINAKQIAIDYNNESVLFKHESNWYEFASLEDKRYFLEYMSTIFEEK